MRQIIFLSLCSIFALSCSTPALNSHREPAQESSDQKVKIDNGPYDDCDQRGLFEKGSDFVWVCTDNYVHIYPDRALKRRNAKNIKIGAFNLYHLGDDQGRLKDYKAVALILNQWDVVGATELMPLPTTYANENRKLREVVKEQGEENLPKDWRVVEPGYYKLLKALQKLDSSWSLIFQPLPEGEGSSGEMAGFYYRAKRVQLKPWDYCPYSGLNDKIHQNISGLNFGCVLQIPEAQAKMMSRKAFVAQFKSGQFDFIAAVSHTRFRPPPPEQLVQQQQEICSFYEPGASCSISKDKIGRFYEIKAVADQFPLLEKYDKDIIYMGDFNLDHVGNNQKSWKASLGPERGYAVYQHHNTSLSLPTESLANSYDHFILRSSTLTECDFDSIRAYDFTQIGNDPTNKVLKKLNYLLKPNTHKKTIQEQMAFLEQQIRLERKGKSYTARALTAEEKAKYEEDIQRAVNRLNNNKFWVLREYISDHVPIEMTCQTTNDDD